MLFCDPKENIHTTRGGRTNMHTHPLLVVMLCRLAALMIAAPAAGTIVEHGSPGGCVAQLDRENSNYWDNTVHGQPTESFSIRVKITSHWPPFAHIKLTWVAPTEIQHVYDAEACTKGCPNLISVPTDDAATMLTAQLGPRKHETMAITIAGTGYARQGLNPGLAARSCPATHAPAPCLGQVEGAAHRTMPHRERMVQGAASRAAARRGLRAQARVHHPQLVGRRAAWPESPFGRAPARLLRLLRARLAALAGSARSQGEAGPLGAQPPPRVRELAASKAAHFPAVNHPGRRVSRDHLWRVGGVRTSPPALLLGADEPDDRAAGARLHPQQRAPQPGILGGAQARRVVPPRVQEVGPRRRSRHSPKAPAVADCGAEGARRGRPSAP